MYQIDLEASELCLIDSGIRSLQDVPLRSHVEVLNLHNNAITRIERLDGLEDLKHLDLSSNQVWKLEGLTSLHNLRTLNLSCNKVRVVEGLQNLRSLVKVNLSYNEVEDISGFASLWGSGYKLSNIDLHGNKLHNASHVIQTLVGCTNLRCLNLGQDGSSNPLCYQSGYREKLFRGLPQLQVLDGADREGRPAQTSHILADIPGVENYMEYLLSTDGSSLESKKAELVTPKIDQVLETFRNRGISSSDVSTVAATATDVETTPSSTSTDQPDTNHTVRLEMLENQLAQLLSARKSGSQRPVSSSTDSTITPDPKVAKPKVTKLQAKRDIDQTDESGSDACVRPERSRSRKKKSRIPSYRKATTSSQAKVDATGSTSTTDEQKQSGVPGSRSVSRSPRRRPFSPHVVHVGTGPTATDEQQREDVQATYLVLMKDLESERERRWKAEQAAKKLVDHVKDLQQKARDGSEFQETSSQVMTRLKQALTNEREAKLRLRDDFESSKEQVRMLQQQLSMCQGAEQSQRKALQAMEQTAARTESERLKQQAHESKKVQEAQMKAAATGREVDILKNSGTTLKGQIQQLQELLATREQEFRKELKGRYSLDSKELQDLLEKEGKRAEKLHSNELKSQQEKIDVLSKQYTDLEDEFRLALQIEANRFHELQAAFERVSQDGAENKQALLAAQKKDEKSSGMLTELTSLVKEQKGRITELSRSKQEKTLEFKERMQTLEAHVEEARKRMLQMELLKQEKGKLQAEVQGQESVIEGLRSERKLWGHELAQQGASLAQDRGRLEAQIETLTSELNMAKKLCQRETDGVKIKTKMLEDQTETIRKLKQAVIDRDGEIKQVREESLQLQRQLEDQLNEEKGANQDSQETLERLRERKEELKQQLTELQTELEESKKAHSILNKRWKEKSDLIGQLEVQVHQMKNTWENKEKRLTEERDKAVQAASVALEKFHSADNAFRQQLDIKEQNHQEELARLEHENHLEIDKANYRVISVEDEMRLLLEETEANKRAMEEKFKKLTHAFTDLQTGLL